VPIYIGHRIYWSGTKILAGLGGADAYDEIRLILRDDDLREMLFPRESDMFGPRNFIFNFWFSGFIVVADR
jgi:hypothetical protein